MAFINQCNPMNFQYNVGIGTETPAYKLEVSGSSSSDWISRFQNSDGIESVGVYLAHGNGYGMAIDSTENDSKYIFKAMAGTGGGGGKGSVPVIFAQHDGKVGIGTQFPDTPLHITAPSGDGVPLLRICGTSAGSTFNWAGSIMNSALGSNRNWVLLIGQAQSTKNSGYIGYNHTGTAGSNSNFLTFGHYGNDNLMNLMADGKLGIGTTSPAAKLAVEGSANDVENVARFNNQVNCTTRVWLRNSNHSAYWGLSSTSTADPIASGTIAGAMTLGFGNNFPIQFWNGSPTSVKMTIASDGNVGIGCNLPRNKTEIIGGTSSPDLCAASCDLLKVAGSANTALNIGSTIVSPYGMWLQVKHQNLDNLTYPMVFQPCGGNTGIGIMNPTYKLHVNGTFYAAGSSIKYKEGICNYDTNSCLFMCLKPVTYQYKDEFKHLGKELKADTQIGLIAEDVAEVMPELAVLVNEEDEKVVRNVDYEKLSIVLLAEVQKLRKEMDELKQSC